MRKRLDILLATIVSLLMTITAVSCSSSDEPDTPAAPPETGNTVSFKFKIYTDKAAARSRALGVWEEDAANVAERILDPNDMRVIILSADGKIIRTVKPTTLEYNGSGISGDGYYEMTVKFEDSNLERWPDNKRVTFQVMVLANINSLGGLYLTDGLLTGTSIQDIQETFVMSPEWYPTETSGIPMYGLTTSINMSIAELKDPEGSTPGEIYLLRALSKIEVFDRVAKTVGSDGVQYPHITGVELISWRDHGYIRLADPYANYFINGIVKAGNIHPEGLTTTPLKAHEEVEVVDGKNVGYYRLYCPEAKLSEVTVRVHALLGPGRKKTYDVSLGQYADGDKATPEFGNDLVRNHIYRFNVEKLGPTADINVTVADWTVVPEEYTDVVSMNENGFLSWDLTGKTEYFAVGTTEYNKKQEQMLSMLKGTTDYVTGTFHIASPRDAVWRAYFVPGDNGVDAFEFVDVDASGNVIPGTEKLYAEGVVDGNAATIHIRGKGAADIYRHWAELVIEVRSIDGTVVRAPLTATTMSERFIIYRENIL